LLEVALIAFTIFVFVWILGGFGAGWLVWVELFLMLLSQIGPHGKENADAVPAFVDFTRFCICVWLFCTAVRRISFSIDHAHEK
jgi:hypothetical protein